LNDKGKDEEESEREKKFGRNNNLITAEYERGYLVFPTHYT
jgi:hypothetical protein